jgi:hypothetical protein
MTLARMRAKKSVLLALRAQGLKPQHFSVREIAVLTEYYLNQHRAELMGEAAEVIATWPGLARWRSAEEAVVNPQKSNARQKQTARSCDNSPMTDTTPMAENRTLLCRQPNSDGAISACGSKADMMPTRANVPF